MKYNLKKYYLQHENGSIKLLNDFLLGYSLRQGHAVEVRRPMTKLYVNQNFGFELFFIWAEFPNLDLVESYIDGKLPENIGNLLKQIMGFDSLKFKEPIEESDDLVYAYEDIGYEYYTLNFPHEKMGTEVNPYYFKNKLTHTLPESLIVQLHEEIVVWLNELFKNLKE
jgi:hypothetical protein